MDKKKRFYWIIGIVTVVLAAGLVLLLSYYFSRHLQKSHLYKAVSAYWEGETNWKAPEKVTYDFDSAERAFIEGMEAFDSGDWEKAKKYYQEALEKTGTDPALPAFVYYYQNLCEVNLTGEGNAEMVESALKSIRNYAPLINNTDILWKLFSSISLSPKSDAKAITLMKDHLEKTDQHMELSTWTWLKNYVAMLEYNNQEYAKSIRGFYDVELTLESVRMTPKLEAEYWYAKEYIANIYTIFKDYENAAIKYQELIDMSEDSEVFQAYACCINLASAYLEIDEIERAKEAIRELEKQLNRVDPALLPEVESSLNDLKANICLEEGDLAEAERYLKEAEQFYLDNEGDEAYLGGRYFTILTKCKYLSSTGKEEKCLEILEELIVSGEAIYQGFEKEVYELMKEIYEKTGDSESLILIYEKLLEENEEFMETTSREYLEFSEYYRENSQLRRSNRNLTRTNSISVVILVITLLVLAGVMILMKGLRTRNITDQLTGVKNRKKLMQLKRLYKRKKTPAHFGVIMLDVDYFKKYNDTYGHVGGDEVLRKVAGVLLTSVRNKDTIIRYGGEEFLILLSDVTSQIAESVCKRIHEQLEREKIEHSASEVSEYVTLSIGLCHQMNAGTAGLEELIEEADKCLYESKKEGRNRTTVKWI